MQRTKNIPRAANTALRTPPVPRLEPCSSLEERKDVSHLVRRVQEIKLTEHAPERLAPHMCALAGWYKEDNQQLYTSEKVHATNIAYTVGRYEDCRTYSLP